MSGRLADKVLVIVGGTGGLGQSATRACLAEGALVVAVGRDRTRAEQLSQELGERLVCITGDARDTEVVEEAIRTAVHLGGRLDGLYHVAGGSGRSHGDGPVHEITQQGWEQTIQWNLTSVFYSNQAAIRQLLAQGTPGGILNMSSVLASRPAPKYFATHAYAAAKAGIIGMTTAAAAYYAPRGIRCNVVTPALVDTAMAQRAVANPEIANYAAQRQPLGGSRVGLPSDLDGAVVFLLSDEASYITGQVLAVDGGWSVSS